MITGESYLLRATRDWLRANMALGEHEIDVEPEESVPAIAGRTYVALIPNGLGLGPRHDSSGGVYDILHGIRIVVYRRIAEVARDRRRGTFLDNLTGLNALVNQVMFLVDWRLDVMLLATQALQADIPTGGAFIEPLRAMSIDEKPRLVLPNDYDAFSQPAIGATEVVAIARGVNFGRCRRMQAVTRT